MIRSMICARARSAPNDIVGAAAGGFGRNRKITSKPPLPPQEVIQSASGSSSILFQQLVKFPPDVPYRTWGILTFAMSVFTVGECYNYFADREELLHDARSVKYSESIVKSHTVSQALQNLEWKISRNPPDRLPFLLKNGILESVQDALNSRDDEVVRYCVSFLLEMMQRDWFVKELVKNERFIQVITDLLDKMLKPENIDTSFTHLGEDDAPSDKLSGLIDIIEKLSLEPELLLTPKLVKCLTILSTKVLSGPNVRNLISERNPFIGFDKNEEDAWEQDLAIRLGRILHGLSMHKDKTLVLSLAEASVNILLANESLAATSEYDPYLSVATWTSLLNILDVVKEKCKPLGIDPKEWWNLSSYQAGFGSNEIGWKALQNVRLLMPEYEDSFLFKYQGLRNRLLGIMDAMFAKEVDSFANSVLFAIFWGFGRTLFALRGLTPVVATTMTPDSPIPKEFYTFAKPPAMSSSSSTIQTATRSSSSSMRPKIILASRTGLRAAFGASIFLTLNYAIDTLGDSVKLKSDLAQPLHAILDTMVISASSLYLLKHTPYFFFPSLMGIIADVDGYKESEITYFKHHGPVYTRRGRDGGWT